MKFSGSFVALATLAATSGAVARKFTVVNKCSITIWPGLFTDMNVAGNTRPGQATGWEAAPGSSLSFDVPDNWKAGRIWGRTNCDFSKGPLACDTGACNGGLLCDVSAGTGVPPATVAEWTLVGDGNQDWFDVSLVDGFNLPMEITNSGDCKAPACKVDLNPGCPSQLAAPGGCKSACFANLDGNQADSGNCCSGSHNTPATCPPSGVQFYDYFKQGCPDAYAYAYDEASGSALFTCDSNKKVDYTLTFCP